MGASVSVTVANLTMEAVESRALSSFAVPPKVFLRYVDDCFCVLQREALPAFTSQLNSIEHSIQFTVEEESEGCLPFLDVLVKREDGHLKFSVYRKSTHTGRYLNFRSLNPSCHKRSVVSTLLKRAQRTCSSEEDARSDVETVRRELAACGYPSSFINSVQRQLSRPVQPSNPSAKKRASVPYAPGFSEALARILRSYDVQVSHIPARKLGNSLTNVKDKLERERFPGVVYKIPCTDCTHVYIGETGNFKRRLREHCNDVKNRKVTSNALAEHVVSTGHAINWEDASVIATEKKLFPRLHLESLFIQTTAHTLNKNCGNLPPVYARCLKHVIRQPYK